MKDEHPVRLTLWGDIPSKKNRYLPRHGRMIKISSVSRIIDELAVQVPGWLRGKKLTHPDVSVTFTVPKSSTRRDRDGMLTTILDVLVDLGVIKDDCIASFNGKLTVYPAIISDHFKCDIAMSARNRNPYATIGEYARACRIDEAALFGEPEGRCVICGASYAPGAEDSSRWMTISIEPGGFQIASGIHQELPDAGLLCGSDICYFEATQKARLLITREHA